MRADLVAPSGLHGLFETEEGVQAMKFPGIRTETLKFELPNNSVNIDKFLKMFMDRTNGILFYELASCRNILK